MLMFPSRRSPSSVAMASLALAILSGPAAAQKVATRQLAKPLAEAAEPFSGVLDVRELSTGALVVLDGKDNLLQYLSPDLASVKAVAREGSGPTEYRRVTQVLARKADTTLAYDVMNARFLVISPSGAAVSTVSLREASGGLPVGPMAVRGYDATGRLLFQGFKVSITPKGPALSDTAPILRLDPARKAVDTLAKLHIGTPGMQMSGDVQKGGGTVRLSMPAYPIVDEWAMLPDGRVVVLRGADYRIEFISGPGAVTTKGPVPYERVKVTDADKTEEAKTRELMQKEVTKAAASARASMPKTSSAPKAMPGIVVDAPTEWPEYKPAFTTGALRLAPDGELWVHRLRGAGEKGQAWDVFSRDGVLKMRVATPDKVHLVAIGAKHVYTVRVDEDELQWLERRPRP